MRDDIVQWDKLGIEKDGKQVVGMMYGVPMYKASEESDLPKGNISLYSWDEWAKIRAVAIWKESELFNERKMKLRILHRKRRHLWQYRILRLLCRWWGIVWEEST